METKSFEEIHAHAEAAYQGIELLFKFMERYQDPLMAVLVANEFAHRETALKQLWVRAFSWVKSLSLLSHSSCFQSVAVANRSLFELCIDLILLHQEKTNELGFKIFWFSQSELLKDATCITDYFSRKNINVPGEFQFAEEFIRNKGAAIERVREETWGSKKHPKCRWTGSKNLLEDARKADANSPDFVNQILGCGFEEYYETSYRKLNWDIHSNSTAFVNDSMEFVDTKNFLRLVKSSHFAMICTQTVLTDFGIIQHLSDFRALQDELLIAQGKLILAASN